MKLPRMLLCLVLLCLSSIAMAQNRTITGIVLSADDNMGIPFANVMARGTTIGVVTDINGKYSISVPDHVTELEFSFMGFKTEIREIGGHRTIDVILGSGAVGLDEVVVVGYGTQRRSHLTGSVTRVGEEMLKDAPVSRLDQALQGRIAGVTISNTTSEAGADPTIRVRGMGSISASSAPLVVVDGIPIQDGMSFINPQDVESIEILKDAASTAIYGSRGANGVIIITTKSGDIAKPKYNFTTTQGYRRAYKLNDKLTYSEYTEILFNERNLRRLDPQYVLEDEGTYRSIDPGLGFRNPLLIQIENRNNMPAAYILENYLVGQPTDAEGWVLRDFAYNNTYDLSVSGGTKEVRYFLSGNVASDNGIMRNSTFNQMRLRAKVDATLSPNVKVGVNLNPSYSQRERPYVQMENFTRWPSCLPIFHNEATAAFTGKPVGSYAQPQDFRGLAYEGIMPDGSVSIHTSATPFGSGDPSPFWRFDQGNRFGETYRITASAYVDITLAKNLTFRSTESFFVNFNSETDWRNPGWAFGEPNRGVFSTGQRVEFLTENILSYNTTINKHHSINAIGGVTYQRINFLASRIEGTNFPSNNVRTLNQAVTKNDAGTWTIIDPSRILASYLARGTYAYRDKYLASGSLRADGSSRFGPDNRWGWFPSLSGGWRISEETFMKPYRNWLDQAKARVSWGITGNYDIESLAYENLLWSSNYELGSTVQPGLGPYGNAIGNPKIGWEQTKEWNYGLDLSLFHGKLGVTLDYYYALTDGLLFKQPMMSFTGSNTYWNNIGAVRNKGVEIEVTTVNVATKKLRWTTSFNFAANRNKLLSLGGDLRMINPGANFDRYISIVGQVPIQFYGFRTDGVWISQAEIDAAIAAGRRVSTNQVSDQPGGLKVVDADGNVNVVIDDYSRTTLGNPFPDFTWGITNTIMGYGFDLSFLFNGVQNISLYNDDGRYVENMRTARRWVENRWISPNNPGDGKTPNIESVGQTPHPAITDWVIQNGSYIALRNVTLGYTLPKELAKKTKFSNVRAYLAVENCLYFWNIGHKGVTPYKGINPEGRMTGGVYANPLISGIQRGSYPIQSSYVLGLNVTF